MDEKLEQVLHKVELLCEQDPEFAAALRNKLGITVASSPVPVQDERIGKIEEYLGLDYKIDTISPAGTVYHELDYSFIKDSAVRKMLEVDFREMMRYKCGCRSHYKDFKEFCKYAHYQLEGLINYFMEIWSLDDEDKFDAELAKKNIRDNWPKELDDPTFRTEVKSPDDIDYFQKVTSILKFLGINKKVVSQFQYDTIYSPTKEKVQITYYLGDVIHNIRRVRNELSHRGTDKIKNINDLIEKFEKRRKFGRDTLNNVIFTFDLKSQEDKDVKYYMWFNYTPWDDVIKAVCMLEEAAREVFKQE